MTVLVNGAVFRDGSPQQIAADPDVRAVYLGETPVGNPATEAGHG